MSGRCRGGVRRLPLGIALVFAILGVSYPGLGQAQVTTDAGLDIEHLYPMPLGFATLDRSLAQRWPEYTVGLYLHYARNPLVLFEERLQIGEVVGHRLSADVVASVGITSWLDVGLAVPVTFVQDGDDGLGTGALSSAGLRDIRIHPKFSLLKQRKYGVGLALVPQIHLPTGSDESFMGNGGFTFHPQVLLDRRFALLWGLRLGAGLGFRLRPRAEVGNIEVDDELTYQFGGGLGLPDVGPLSPEALIELAGTTGIDAPFSKREGNPLLVRVGARAGWEVESGHRIILSTGVTVGLTAGYGAPDAQVWLGISYQRFLHDRDDDGVPDVEDECPDVPEDLDGFEDDDGCPEDDNDRDGIPDTKDACPEEAEDFNDVEDEDGCPDPDEDRDGVPDTKDKCPEELEDLDGFEDDDGCPELDDDRDGVPDTRDRCPGEPETINGIDDEDGCPDDGDPQVEVTSEKVTIDTKIQFGFDSADIKEESFSILNQVAQTLQANPQLRKIRVEGHTDSRGRDEYNLELSQRRAESVVEYLMARGVDPERLEAVGYGEMRPLIDKETKAAWSKNRRVEFTIVDRESE